MKVETMQDETRKDWIKLRRYLQTHNSGWLSPHPHIHLFMEETSQVLIVGTPSMFSGKETSLRQTSLRWRGPCTWLQHIEYLELPSRMEAQILPLVYSTVQLGNKDESEGWRVAIAMRAKAVYECVCMRAHRVSYMRMTEWSVFKLRP